MKKPIFILEAGSHTVVGTRAKVMGAVKGGYLKFARNKHRPASDRRTEKFPIRLISPDAPEGFEDFTRPFLLEELLDYYDDRNCTMCAGGRA